MKYSLEGNENRNRHRNRIKREKVNSNFNSDVNEHAPLSDEAILALFCSDTEESDFSGFSASED